LNAGEKGGQEPDFAGDNPMGREMRTPLPRTYRAINSWYGALVLEEGLTPKHHFATPVDRNGLGRAAGRMKAVYHQAVKLFRQVWQVPNFRFGREVSGKRGYEG
jgi:hypothetical protein